MGEENRADDLVVYADGQPVGRVEEFQLTEVDTMPEGCQAEDLAAAAARMAEAWKSITVTVGEAAAAIAEILERYKEYMEWQDALRWAEAHNRPMAWRYHHTKKKRTRKKYAKRIMAWYRGD